MKKVIILHINDGNSEVATNGNRMFVETFPKAQSEIEKYLNEGWEVKQMIPEVTPSVNKEGAYSFYKSGFTIYMEKESQDN